MCAQGWQWDILKCQVEEALPALPAVVQAALNTGNQVSSSGNEAMFAICQHIRGVQVCVYFLAPSCPIQTQLRSIPVQCGVLCLEDGGGKEPLIRILDHVSSQVAYMIVAPSSLQPCLFLILFAHEANASLPPSTSEKTS